MPDRREESTRERSFTRDELRDHPAAVMGSIATAERVVVTDGGRVRLTISRQTDELPPSE